MRVARHSVGLDRAAARDSKGFARAALGFAQVPRNGNVNLKRRLNSRPAPESYPTRNAMRRSCCRWSSLGCRCSVFAGRTAEAEEQGHRDSISHERLATRTLSPEFRGSPPGTVATGYGNERLAIGVEPLRSRRIPDASLMTRVCEITDLLELGRREAFDRAISQYEWARATPRLRALYNVRVYGSTRAILEVGSRTPAHRGAGSSDRLADLFSHAELLQRRDPLDSARTRARPRDRGRVSSLLRDRTAERPPPEYHPAPLRRDG